MVRRKVFPGSGSSVAADQAVKWQLAQQDRLTRRLPEQDACPERRMLADRRCHIAGCAAAEHLQLALDIRELFGRDHILMHDAPFLLRRRRADLANLVKNADGGVCEMAISGSKRQH
jgi:hypothetical protein